MTDDIRDIVETEEDRAEERQVWLILSIAVLGIFFLVTAITGPLVIKGYLKSDSYFALVVIVSLTLSALAIGPWCTIRLLDYNTAAFVYNPITRKTRTIVGGWRFKLWWERPEPRDLSYEHAIRTDDKIKYLTKDNIYIQLKSLTLMRPDVTRLPTYEKHDNDKVIDPEARAAIQNILKAFCQEHNAQDIMQNVSDISSPSDPYQIFFWRYPWDKFKEDYGVVVKSSKIESVEFPEVSVKAANTVQVAIAIRKMADVITKGHPEYSYNEAIQKAQLIWDEKESQVYINSSNPTGPNPKNKKKGHK